jgi:hypothetical protein
MRGDSREGRLPRLHYHARDHIRVHNTNAEGFEAIGDGRLAAADASRDTYNQSHRNCRSETE